MKVEIKHIDLLCKEKAKGARVKLERATAKEGPGVQEPGMTGAAQEGNRWWI